MHKDAVRGRETPGRRARIRLAAENLSVEIFDPAHIR
jgi:hypothetical protein